MFYLITYFKTLWSGRTVGVFYGVLTLAVLSYSANIFNFKQQYIDQSKNPYFNALFNAKGDPTKIVEKLKNIPGVERVALAQDMKGNQEILNLVKNSSSQVVGSILGANYINLKVELNPHIEVRSQDLIKEYLRRTLGKTKVTMSKTITHSSASKVNDPLRSFVLSYGHYLLLAFLVMVWLFATWVMGQKLQNRSYLINTFQRRKLVAFKMFSIGQAFWMVLGLVVSFAIGGHILMLLTIGAFMTITGLGLLSVRKNEFIKT